jgi:hypothetical protein
MPAGRPSKRFHRQVAEQILDRWVISELTLEEVVEEIRKTNSLCPSIRVLYIWARTIKEFQQSYRLAKQDHAEYLAEIAQKTGRDTRKGIFRKVSTKHGTEVREDDNVARSRLYYEALMKRAGQLHPQEYRERLYDSRGEDSGNEQLEALQKALLAGPAPPDPDDPSANLGTKKPDFTELEKPEENSEEKPK